MRQHDRSNVTYIVGFVVLAAVLAAEGFGISRSGRTEMSDGASSHAIMSASYDRRQ